MLQVRSISRSFDDTLVLDDVSFDAAAGRITGFVGANGSRSAPPSSTNRTC
jgi:ABC-2 type transport system ATP-binding protein